MRSEHKTAEVIRIDARRSHRAGASTDSRRHGPPRHGAGHVMQLRPPQSRSQPTAQKRFTSFMTIVALITAAVVMIAIALG